MISRDFQKKLWKKFRHFFTLCEFSKFCMILPGLYKRNQSKIFWNVHGVFGAYFFISLNSMLFYNRFQKTENNKTQSSRQSMNYFISKNNFRKTSNFGLVLGLYRFPNSHSTKRIEFCPPYSGQIVISNWNCPNLEFCKRCKILFYPNVSL